MERKQKEGRERGRQENKEFLDTAIGNKSHSEYNIHNKAVILNPSTFVTLYPS